jgi:hypothetical protein
VLGVPFFTGSSAFLATVGEHFLLSGCRIGQDCCVIKADTPLVAQLEQGHIQLH